MVQICLALALSVSVSAGGENEGALDLVELLSMDMDVVVAATGKASSLEDAPAIVSVINHREILAAGYRTVGEALRTVPGISIINDHVETNVGIRGFFAANDSASDILKLMINGQPVAFRPTSGNFFDYDLIPIKAVKRIEIIRGPASALYGANAYLGVVNVVTFTGEDLMHRGSVDGQGFYLSNPKNQSTNGAGSLLATGSWADIELLVSATYASTDRSGLVLPGTRDMKSDSPEGTPSPGWGSREREREKFLSRNISENDVAKEASMYTLLSYGSHDDWGKLILDGHYQFREKGAEFLADSVLTHQSTIALTNSFLRLQYESTRGSSGFYWDASLSYAQGAPTENDRIVDELELSKAEDDRSPLIRHFGAEAMSAALELNYGWGAHTVTVGFDFDQDNENLLSLQKEGQDESDGYGDRTFTNMAAYTQLIYGISDDITATAGARADNNSVIVCNSDDWNCFGEQTSKLSPMETAAGDITSGEGESKGGQYQLSSRFALVYNPKWTPAYFKLSYGTSYKAPTAYQLYHPTVSKNFGSQGMPLLTPQTANTIEAQVGYKTSTGFAATLGGYFLETKNLVASFEASGGGSLGLNANGQSAGIEAEVQYTVDDRLIIRWNGSYLLSAQVTPQMPDTETEFTWDDSPLNATVDVGRYPFMTSNLYVAWTIPEYYIRIATNLHYVGARNASLVNNELTNKYDLEKTYQLDPYICARLNISTVDFYLSNFLDETVVGLLFTGTLGQRYVDPGFGGIDIPSLGPAAFLRITQRF